MSACNRWSLTQQHSIIYPPILPNDKFLPANGIGLSNCNYLFYLTVLIRVVSLMEWFVFFSSNGKSINMKLGVFNIHETDEMGFFMRLPSYLSSQTARFISSGPFLIKWSCTKKVIIYQFETNDLSFRPGGKAGFEPSECVNSFIECVQKTTLLISQVKAF